ncbi:MAG: hypothetical protein ABSA52_03085 [Candidatus Binatia bacterium]|jgi:hypothetical protein
MVKRVFLMTGLAGLAASTVLLATVGSARAQTLPASDRPAGLVIYPKIVSDPSAIFTLGSGPRTDTLIRLTNVSAASVTAECFYVDGTSHCSIGINSFDPVTGACRTNSDCDEGGTCVPASCQTGIPDFPLTLTPNQTVGWVVSTGGTLPESAGTVPPAPTLFFIGELKCIEGTFTSGGAFEALNANDLVGGATIETVTSGSPGSVDAREYSAIGLAAVSAPAAPGSTGQTLCLGETPGSTECTVANYANCPSTLILDHFFDYAAAASDTTGVSLQTDLTLVPCSESPEGGGTVPRTAVQFLVYNEFEQRFSTSMAFSCFNEIELSQIDTRPGQEQYSIFNENVQGTLSGQTKIRPVPGSETEIGHGLLGVAEQFFTYNLNGATGSAAWNLNYLGANGTQGDFLRIP